MKDESKKIKTRVLKTYNIYNLFKKLQKEGYIIEISLNNNKNSKIKTAYIYKNYENKTNNNFLVKINYEEQLDDFKYYTKFKQIIYTICY